MLLNLTAYAAIGPIAIGLAWSQQTWSPVTLWISLTVTSVIIQAVSWRPGGRRRLDYESRFGPEAAPDEIAPQFTARHPFPPPDTAQGDEVDSMPTPGTV